MWFELNTDELLGAFDKKELQITVFGGKKYCKWTSTLPTGHRATSFINSILNRAYLVHLLPECESYHAGDDVYITKAVSMLPIVRSGVVELNPAKPSWGHQGEFLRNVLTTSGIFGYPCRSIATFISGNWLTDVEYEDTPTLITSLNS